MVVTIPCILGGDQISRCILWLLKRQGLMDREHTYRINFKCSRCRRFDASNRLDLVLITAMIVTDQVEQPRNISCFNWTTETHQRTMFISPCVGATKANDKAPKYNFFISNFGSINFPCFPYTCYSAPCRLEGVSSTHASSLPAAFTWLTPGN